MGKIDNSFEAYKEKYEKGYGVVYPEGHIIRFYERFLKYEKKMTSGKILDFGCGNGTHMKYFQDKGFEVYGLDIVPEAILNVNEMIGGGGYLIEPNQRLLGLFDFKFDLIVANQSLYYLPCNVLRQTVQDLFELTKDGGFCFFTMMSEKNAYNALRRAELDNGLSEVRVEGRLNETTFINFVKNEEELISIFKPYKPVYIGDYDFYNLYEKYGGEGSGHHYIYIGEKEIKSD